MQRRSARIGFLSTTLLLLAAANAVAGVERSEMSLWMERDAVPSIRALLAEHPRYRGEALLVRADDGDALEAALVTVLRTNLAGRPGVRLAVGSTMPDAPPPLPQTIDSLDCSNAPDHRYQLRIAARSSGRRRGEVLLTLREAQQPGVVLQQWRWSGTFSRAERDHLERRDEDARGRGTPTAPWRAGDEAPAAAALSRQLACGLRQQLRTHLALDWVDSRSWPAPLAGALLESRHRLANYRELSLQGNAADYRLEVRLEPLARKTWQVWLTARPERDGLYPVEAVGYFDLPPAAAEARAATPLWGVNDREPASAGSVSARPAAAAPAGADTGRRADSSAGAAAGGGALTAYQRPPARIPGPANNFLQVELLEATLSEDGASRARLALRLRLENRAEHPLEYAFSLSAGYYLHCVPESGLYRHHRNGHLEGRLAPGETQVRTLVIDGVRHRPAPLFGASQCAGFRDLAGFERFPSEGHRVTRYVRWSM